MNSHKPFHSFVSNLQILVSGFLQYLSKSRVSDVFLFYLKNSDCFVWFINLINSFWNLSMKSRLGILFKICKTWNYVLKLFSTWKITKHVWGCFPISFLQVKLERNEKKRSGTVFPFGKIKNVILACFSFLLRITAQKRGFYRLKNWKSAPRRLFNNQTPKNMYLRFFEVEK